MADHRIRHILLAGDFAPSAARIRWQRRDPRRDVVVVGRRTDPGCSLHEQVDTDHRWVDHGQGGPVAEIGNHDRDGGNRHSDGVAGYGVGSHVAGNHGAEGDARSIHSPEGKDDDPVVASENGRNDRYVESHPEAVMMVSS